MKKFFWGSVALAALTLPDIAQAADLGLRYKAPVAYMAGPFNWTGIYVGAVGGAGLFSSTFSDTFCTFSCAGPEQAKVD
jgi:hypothetical protein